MKKNLNEKERIKQILQLANQEVRAIHKAKKINKGNTIEVNCTREDILKTMKKK